MKTRQIKIYSFEELSEKAKERALQRLWESEWELLCSQMYSDSKNGHETFWYPYDKELEEDGWYNIKFDWDFDESLWGWVGFEAELDIRRWLERRALVNSFWPIYELVGNYSVKTEKSNSGFGNHPPRVEAEESIYLDYEYESYQHNQLNEDEKPLWAELKVLIVEDIEWRFRKLTKELREEMEYPLSEDSLRAYAVENELEFYEDGRPYYGELEDDEE